jgi:hypothetical protein
VFYIIFLHKLIYGIRTVCIEDRERLKGKLICGTRKLERISVSRHKEYQYFV